MAHFREVAPSLALVCLLKDRPGGGDAGSHDRARAGYASGSDGGGGSAGGGLPPLPRSGLSLKSSALMDHNILVFANALREMLS